MKKVLLLITDGFADWEASYVSAELNKPGTGYEVRTIAIDKQPKTSMGGLRIVPDYELGDEYPTDLAMLILPGGTGWGEAKNQQAKEIAAYCVNNGIPVAAICDATSFMGRHGFLDQVKHTGNTLPYLKEGAPAYRGEEYYIDAQSVSDGNVITANGSGAVEFSAHILQKLNVLQGDALKEWYEVFKKGYFPFDENEAV